MKTSLSNLRIVVRHRPLSPSINDQPCSFLNDAVHQTTSLGGVMVNFRHKDYGSNSLEPKESALRHQSPQQALRNDQLTKAWDPHHHHSSSLSRDRADSRQEDLFLSGKWEGTRCLPSDPPSPPCSLRTPPHLEPLSTLSTAEKPSPSHTQDGSGTPTRGNSCATTPAMPASRLRVSPLAPPKSARQAESSDSQSEGGAIGRRRAAGDTRAEPLEAWTQSGVQPMGSRPSSGSSGCPAPPI